MALALQTMRVPKTKQIMSQLADDMYGSISCQLQEMQYAYRWKPCQRRETKRENSHGECQQKERRAEMKRDSKLKEDEEETAMASGHCCEWRPSLGAQRFSF